METFTPPAAKDLAGPMRFLFWLSRSQARRVAFGAFLGTAWLVCLTVPPWVLSRAVDQGLTGHDTSALVEWSLVLLGFSVLIAYLGIMRHRTMTKTRMDAAFRCVQATVRQTARLGASLSRQVNAGEVVTIGISDVYVVAVSLTFWGPGVGSVIAYVVVAVVLFTISPVLAAVVLAGVPLIVVAVGPLLQRIERTGGAYRTHQGQLTTRLVDVLAGLRVLNGLGGKQYVADRYEEQSLRLVQRGYKVAGPASWVESLSRGLPALFLAVVVWLSARMAATGAISIGEVVAVYGYVAVLVIPVATLIEFGGDLARARVAGQRIVDILNLPVSRSPLPRDAEPLTDPVSGVIVRPGVLTALVAARSAEAVAVVERLGLVGRTPDDEFRQRLVVADNDAELFAGTVRDVIAGRLPATDDDIRTALQVAVAEDIVEALPGGLDAHIAAGGSDLSGGQRQRIRLARAVYASPDTLLAIEPTSAVDATTEAAVIDRLLAARRGTTTVITTTSPLVLDRADDVIFLTDGKVSAVGTHAGLVRADAHYRAIVSR